MPELGLKVAVKGEPGTVRFIGTTKFAPGEWIGVELDASVGKNDGSLQGIRYFKCKKPGNYGVFVRAAMLGSSEQGSYSRDVLSVVEKLQVKLKAARLEILSTKAELERANNNSKRVEELEINLEEKSVEVDYLKSHNTALSNELQKLQTKYAALSADYDLLNEEMELNRELEEMVKLGFNGTEPVSTEDYQLLVQHNRKLEIAVSSLKKLASEKENKFMEEIQTLRSESANLSDLQRAYDSAVGRLEQAETTITHLQEQLESATELEQIIEHLTGENEALKLKNKELSETVNELQEIHELDKSLEENLRKVEQELKNQIENLLHQISNEKSLADTLTSKHSKLQDELRQLKTQPLSTMDTVAIEAVKLELRKLRVQLDEYKFKFGVNQRILVSLDVLNSQVVPEKFQLPIAALKKIREISALLAEIISNMYGSFLSVLELQAFHYLDILDLSLKTLAARIELDPDISKSDIEELCNHMDAIQLDLQQGFDKLYFDRLDTVSLLTSHTQRIRNSLILSLQSPTWSILQVSNILLQARYSDVLSRWIIDTTPPEGEIRFQYDSLRKESEELADKALAILEEITNNQELEVSTFPDTLSDFNEKLITFLRLEDDSQISSKFAVEEIENYVSVVSNLTQNLTTTASQGGKQHTTIYERIHKDTESIPNRKEVDPDNVQKDRVINDLKLNIELLEKNMGTTIEIKTAKIQELKDMLFKTQDQLQELEKNHRALIKTNKSLDDQLQTLFADSVLANKNQIRTFEDLKAKKNYTAEMALLEEIVLLRKMVLQSTDSKNMSDAWLIEPIYPTINPPKSTFESFEKRSREIRDQARFILQQILRSKQTLTRTHAK